MQISCMYPEGEIINLNCLKSDFRDLIFLPSSICSLLMKFSFVGAARILAFRFTNSWPKLVSFILTVDYIRTTRPSSWQLRKLYWLTSSRKVSVDIVNITTLGFVGSFITAGSENITVHLHISERNVQNVNVSFHVYKHVFLVCFFCVFFFFCFFLRRANLCLVKELGDRAAQGRTYGNLGNTYYLLGDFETAVAAHEKVGKSPA